MSFGTIDGAQLDLRIMNSTQCAIKLAWPESFRREEQEPAHHDDAVIRLWHSTCYAWAAGIAPDHGNTNAAKRHTPLRRRCILLVS
jgi:hypothetical protein